MAPRAWKVTANLEGVSVASIALNLAPLFLIGERYCPSGPTEPNLWGRGDRPVQRQAGLTQKKITAPAALSSGSPTCPHREVSWVPHPAASQRRQQGGGEGPPQKGPTKGKAGFLAPDKDRCEDRSVKRTLEPECEVCPASHFVESNSHTIKLSLSKPTIQCLVQV